MTTLHWIGVILVGWVSCNVLSVLILKLTVKTERWLTPNDYAFPMPHECLMVTLLLGPVGLILTVFYFVVVTIHASDSIKIIIDFISYSIKRIADFINKG